MHRKPRPADGATPATARAGGARQVVDFVWLDDLGDGAPPAAGSEGVAAPRYGFAETVGASPAPEVPHDRCHESRRG